MQVDDRVLVRVVADLPHAPRTLEPRAQQRSYQPVQQLGCRGIASFENRFRRFHQGIWQETKMVANIWHVLLTSGLWHQLVGLCEGFPCRKAMDLASRGQ